MGTDRIAELTGRREKLVTQKSVLQELRFSLARDEAAVIEEIAVLDREIDAARPIENSVAWIPSHSRAGSHLTVVAEGEGFCTCEDARYRNPEGGCKHYAEAVERGYHDPRAVFRGGFDGPVTTDNAATALLKNTLMDLSSIGVRSTSN